MAKSKGTPTSLRQTLEHNLRQLEQHLPKTDLTALARQTGFLQRLPRKIPVLKLVLALVALAAETVLSLERVASAISLVAGTSYSKQAFQERLGLKLESFLAQVATVLFGQLSQPLQDQGWFKAFQRVLLHDSTGHTLPEHLARAFPGGANARKRRYAALRIQFICDLLYTPRCCT
jgi:hypothetical protein